MTTGDVELDPRYCLECGWIRTDPSLPHRACWDYVIDGDLARRVADGLLEGRFRSVDGLIPSSDPAVAAEWRRLLSQTDDWMGFDRVLTVLARCGLDGDVPLLEAISRWDSSSVPFALPEPPGFRRGDTSDVQATAKYGLVMSAAGRDVLWPEFEQLSERIQIALLGASVLVRDQRAYPRITALVGEWPVHWQPVPFRDALSLVLGREEALAVLLDEFVERLRREDEGIGYYSPAVDPRQVDLEILAGEETWRSVVLPRLLATRRDAVERLRLGYTPGAPTDPDSYVARQDLPAVTRYRIDLSAPAESTDLAAWDLDPSPRLGGQPSWLDEPTWPLTGSGAPYIFVGQLPVVDEPGRMLYLFMTGPDHENDAQPIVAVMQPGAPPRMPFARMATGPRDYTNVVPDDIHDPRRPLLARLTPSAGIPVRQVVTLVEELEPEWEGVGYGNEYAYLPGDVSKLGGSRRDFDRDPEPPGEWRFLGQLRLDFWSVAVYARPDGIAWTDCSF
jgi:hypothetical protein